MKTKNLLKSLKSRLGWMLCLLALLTCAQGVWAAVPKVIYVTNSDDGQVHLHVWKNNGGSCTSWPGTAMAKVGTSGGVTTWSLDLSECSVQYDRCIVSKNGQYQTADLTIPTDGRNCYDWPSGKWSKYPKETYKIQFKRPSGWTEKPHIHMWNGDGDIANNQEMTAVPNHDGWFYYEFTTGQVKTNLIFNNHGWNGQSNEKSNWTIENACFTCTGNNTDITSTDCPIDCTTPTKSQYTMESQTVSYNGNAQKPSITVATGAGAVSKIYGSTDGGSNWTDYGTSGPVNVGEYKIKINCNAGATYCAKNDIVLDNTFTIQNAQTSYALGGFLNGSEVNNFDENWKLTETSQGSGVYEGSFSFDALYDRCEWLWIIEDNGTKWGRNSNTDILPSGSTTLTKNQSNGKMRAIATVGVKFKVTFVPSSGSLTWAYDYDDLFKDSRTLYIRGPLVDGTWLQPATEPSNYHVLEKVDNTYVVKFYGKASTETDKNKFVITTDFGEEYRLATSGFNLTHCTGDGHSSDDAKYNFIYENDYDPIKGDVLKISITLVDGKPTLEVDQKPLPTVDSVTHGSRCGTGTVGLKATATAGEGTVSIKWYDEKTGGTALGETASGVTWTTSSISTTKTYYAEAVDANFASTKRTPVIATVNPLPKAGTINAGASVCKGSTVTLNVTNPSSASVQWQNSSKQDISGATSTSYTTPALQESTDYYVKFTDSNNCSSTSAKGTATVKDASLSIEASTSTVNPYTRVTLTAKNQSGTETNSNWTITGAGSYFTESDNPTGVSSVVMKPAKDVETTVTATATVEGCEATGTYTVTPTPDTEVCQ